MLWKRLILGGLGLYVAFSAGGKLQLWIDEGKVWYKLKGGGGTTLLSYDETPFSYVSQIIYYIVMVLAGLFFVWLALGEGSSKKKP
jgi:hypothetical protein